MKENKWYLLTIIGLFLLGVSSCKYTCESFPAAERRWVPYEVADTIVYSNGSDALQFEVVDSYFNESTSTRGLFMDIECSIEAFYQTNEVGSYQILEHYGADFRGIFEVRFSDKDIFNFFLTQDSYENDSISTVYSTDTLINEVRYSEVYVVRKNNMDPESRISLIVKAANEGIISFYDQQNNVTWEKLDRQ